MRLGRPQRGSRRVRRRTSAPRAARIVTAIAAAGAIAACAPASVAGAAIESSPPRPRPGLAYVTGGASTAPAVWASSLRGGEPKRLGTGVQPLISPDGSMVAAGLFGAGSFERGPALAVYSTAGEPARELLNLATASATALAWSPDSRYLAVQSSSTAVTNIAALSGLDVLDTRTGVVKTIARGQISGASFAPDGSDRVVFARAPSLATGAPSNLYVSAADGSGLRRLTSDGRSLNPVWASGFIAYDREQLRTNFAPLYQIWLRPTAAGRVRRLTDVPVGPLVVGLVPLAVSRDGRRLLAEFEGQDTSEAWTVRIASGRARRLVARGRSVVADGLSSDGLHVLVDERGLEGPPSRGRVALLSFDGRRRELLVAHGSQASWRG